MSDQQQNPASPNTVTAAVLAIGDELLSGRTKDKNIGYIAEYLTNIGIDLCEARVVADDIGAIADAVNMLREKYTYVFTTGGIGPTHDDITADGIGAAFGRPVGYQPEAKAMLEAYFGDQINEARLRMARMPEGAELIPNPLSKAPGFRVGNVFVMAGVPSIMQAMLDGIAQHLETGAKMLSHSIHGRSLKEGDIGVPLGAIQEAHPGAMIGSYPHYDGKRLSTSLVVRARDQAVLDAAVAAVEAMVESELDKL